MKSLVRIYANCNEKIYPFFIVEAGTEQELEQVTQRALDTCTDIPVELISTDEEGVRWCNGQCWYMEESQPLTDEDAATLVRILSLETYS